jgi:hypothetical protein
MLHAGLDRQLEQVGSGMPLYTGLYLRIVRTYAHIMEFIHKASYADRWNPWKVSRVVKMDRL